jgi:hypothetical protein
MKNPKTCYPLVSLLKKFFFLAVFIFAFSCQSPLPQSKKKIAYIIYGIYYSECGDHCATMFRLEKDRLLVDSTDSYLRDHLKVPRVVFSNKTLSQEAFRHAQVIRTRFPDTLLSVKGKENVFGCPDCGDQGGIFMEIKCGNEVKTFNIDTQLDKIPANLRSYAKLVMEISESSRYK